MTRPTAIMSNLEAPGVDAAPHGQALRSPPPFRSLRSLKGRAPMRGAGTGNREQGTRSEGTGTGERTPNRNPFAAIGYSVAGKP